MAAAIKVLRSRTRRMLATEIELTPDSITAPEYLLPVGCFFLAASCGGLFVIPTEVEESPAVIQIMLRDVSHSARSARSRQAFSMAASPLLIGCNYARPARTTLLLDKTPERYVC